tara:strand:- start:1239 stop:1508 length:270 start_codon:yes stop_codon:yes gene_type:complete
MIRKGLIESKFLLKNGSFIIDLNEVEFLTWNKNVKLADSYWVKLHIGDKDTRYICDSRDELCDIINAWGKIKGKEIKIDKEEIGELYDF